MPADRFPQQEPKEELTQKELESLLEIKLDPNFDTKRLEFYLGSGNYLRFIIAPNYNIYLSSKPHQLMTIKIGAHREDLLLSDGYVKIDAKEIKFEYRSIPKMENIKKAAESKIGQFLKSKGIEIN